MKKFFTLIAAVAMAASMNAQTTYSMAGLSGDNFTYDAAWWTYSNNQFDYLNGSKTDYSTLAMKDTPVSFLYKNSKAKSKAFTISDKYFCAQTKGVQISVSGLTEGQEVAFSVASKGSTAAVFNIVSGCEVVGEMPTLAAKSGEDLKFITIKVKATDATAVIKEIDGGFGIESVIVSEGTSTGITNVHAASSAKSSAIYNLAGQQVNKDYKGVVIQNGKKFLNK